jgi:ribosomal protein S18 acetylase RimI-like enzyme
MRPKEAFHVERCRAVDLPALHEDLLCVYATANADRSDNPFFQPDNFWRRLIACHALADDFLLVLGRIGSTSVGFAFGSPRHEAADIWGMVRRTLPDAAATDDQEPIYVLREIAVHPDHQGRGYGRRLHDALLAGRPERLAQLLVLPDNVAAKRAYYSWGWHDIGPRQPLPESPVGDAMVKFLSF